MSSVRLRDAGRDAGEEFRPTNNKPMVKLAIFGLEKNNLWGGSGNGSYDGRNWRCNGILAKTLSTAWWNVVVAVVVVVVVILVLVLVLAIFNEQALCYSPFAYAIIFEYITQFATTESFYRFRFVLEMMITQSKLGQDTTDPLRSPLPPLIWPYFIYSWWILFAANIQ